METWQKVTLTVMFCISVFLISWYFVSWFSIQNEWSYLAGFFHECGYMAFEGKVPYRDFGCPQPPLGLLIVGFGQFIFKDPFTSKLITLAFTIANIMLTWLIVKQESKEVKLWHMPFFLGLFGVMIIIPLDLMSLTFALAGIYFLRKYEFQNNRYLLILSAVLCAISIMTKYFGMAFAAALFVYLIYSKKYKDTIIFLSVLGIIILPTMGVLQFVTNGNFLTDTFYHVIKPIQEGDSFVFLLMITSLPLLIAMPFCIWKENERTKLYFFCFVFVLFEAIWLWYRSGGTTNYNVYPIVLLSIITYIGFFSKGDKKFSDAIFALIILQFIMLAVYSTTGILQISNGAKTMESNNLLLLDLVKMTDKPVLAEPTSISFWYSRFPNTRFSDPYMFYDFMRLGKWNQSELINAVQKDDVELIIAGWRIQRFNDFTNWLHGKYNVTSVCYIGLDYMYDEPILIYTNNPDIYKKAQEISIEQLKYCDWRQMLS
jgi:hypothetical protein